MTVHLIKLCVGADSLDDLQAWVKKRVKMNERSGAGRVHTHVTRMRPRREDELADGGSLYWVIKGVILVRQKIIGFEKKTGADGVSRTAILLDPPLIRTEPQPRRAFQGWRYLKVEDAPQDLSKTGEKDPPPALQAELANLGLL